MQDTLFALTCLALSDIINICLISGKSGDLMTPSEEYSQVLRKAADYFDSFNFIDFAILFGSFTKNKVNDLSDIDIGLFTNKDMPLLEIGALTAGLESLLKRKVDLITLNDIYKNRPLFAYEIVSNGEIIICHKTANLIEFRKNTFLYYMDIAHMTDTVNKIFRERLDSNKFGERNYVRAG